MIPIKIPTEERTIPMIAKFLSSLCLLILRIPRTIPTIATITVKYGKQHPTTLIIPQTNAAIDKPLSFFLGG